MDQIRTSQIKKGGYYALKYNNNYDTNSDVHCRNVCTSDLSCKTWKYTSTPGLGGNCSTTYEAVTPTTPFTRDKASSGGYIEHASYTSLIQIIVFVVILFLFGVSLVNLINMYSSPQ